MLRDAGAPSGVSIVNKNVDGTAPARRRRRRRGRPWRRPAHAVLLLAVLGALAFASACEPWVPPVRVAPVVTATAEPDPTLHSAPTTLSVVISSNRPGGPVPTGTLTFPTLNNFTVTLSNGVFTWTGQIASFTGGTAPFDYSGDANYLPASGVLQATVEIGMIPYTGTGPSVAMVGDSITFAAKPLIDDRLVAANRRHSVTGVLGWTTATAQPLFDGYAATTPDVFVLDLGTNDLSDIAIGLRGDPATALTALQSRVTAAVGQFPGACVVVSTVSAHRSSAWGPPYAAYNDAAAAFNTWVRATFPHVLDWEVAVQASLTAGSTILMDEVHPNYQGAVVLADLVVQQVDACLGAG